MIRNEIRNFHQSEEQLTDPLTQLDQAMHPNSLSNSLILFFFVVVAEIK